MPIGNGARTAPTHLVGDFAFAVWDEREDKLVLGRDHMGQRSLFYHKGDSFFAFASEIRGLWALADVPHELLDEEIARFFFRTVEHRPEGRTLYSGIAAVPGGTVVATDRRGALRSRHYWEPHADPAHEHHDESYYVEKYRSVLTEAVACRLRRLAGPAALMMSAGFDTAAIAGLAGPVVAAQGRKLISLSWLGTKATETVGGDIRPWLEACRRVMPHLDSREVSRDGENLFTGIERVFSIHDAPGGGARKIAPYLFAEAASAGARLIMDGCGGDYTLNPRGFGALGRLLRRGQFRRFFAELRPHLRETGDTPWQMLKSEIILKQLPQSVIHWQRRLRRKGIFASVELALRDVQGPYLEQLQQRNLAEAKPGMRSLPITSMHARIAQTALRACRDFAAGGTMPAAAHGLDFTRPFHDKRVVELGLAIPEDYYVRNGRNRHIARLALADVYPPEFQTRGRKNEGVLSDDVAVLNAGTPELVAEAGRLANSAKLSAYFNFNEVRRLLSLPGPNDSGEILVGKSVAMRALLTARFIEWFDGANTR